MERIERKLSRVETVTGTDQRCHPGTRVAILDDLRHWLLDDNERSAPSIYWITGVAGCGKSTISRSLLDMARSMGIAHSCFFFSRDHDDRKTCQKLLATVARDLVSHEDPKVIECVYDAVEKKLDSGPFLDQVHHLLRQPLESASHRVVVIWDALDECLDANERSLLCDLITQLPQFPTHLSILITSRPEIDFESVRHHLFQCGQFRHRELTFRPGSDSSTLRDIDTYTAHRFDQIKARQRMGQSWPGEEALKQLNIKIDGLFVVASFFCRFVDHYRCEDRLKRLLETPSHFGNDNDYHYYRTGLQHLFKGDSSEEVNDRQAIIGSILVAQYPPSTNVLAKFAGITWGATKKIVETLYPFLVNTKASEETGSGAWHFMHKSMSDFFASHHAGDFRIDLVDANGALAMPCLQILCSEIQNAFAQCDRTVQPSVPDGDDVAPSLPHVSEGLRYACRFWAYHLKDVTTLNGALEDLLDDFFTHHLLKWLHVMGRFGWLNAAVSGLELMGNWKVCYCSVVSIRIQAHRPIAMCIQTRPRRTRTRWHSVHPGL